MMEASTLLTATTITHILDNGIEVELPQKISFVCEFANPQVAIIASAIKSRLLNTVRVFGFLYTVRFSLQFFGNINPYDGGPIELLYDFTEPFTRLFLGFMPRIYNMDIGLFIGFYALDRIEALIDNIAIVDLAGKIYAG